jgi:hypothetical protein
VQCTICLLGGSTSKPAWRVGGEAMVKVCGVAVAMLPGQSWVPD